MSKICPKCNMVLKEENGNICPNCGYDFALNIKDANENFSENNTKLGFFSAISICYKKCFVFSGRARCSEFWWFFLYFVIMNNLFRFIYGYIVSNSNVNESVAIVFGILILFFVLLIPFLSVQCRRLHDIGLSRYWLFLHLFPLFGSLILFGLCSRESEKGNNKYGPNPKNNRRQLND